MFSSSIKVYVTSLGVSLNSSKIIAPHRPLMNRLACPSLRCINAGVPSAEAGETGDKNRAILQFFNNIFRIYELVDFKQQWLLFSSFGKFSGECCWGQFSLVAVLECYIAWLECQSVSPSLRWKVRHCYHHKEREIHLWGIHGYSLG